MSEPTAPLARRRRSHIAARLRVAWAEWGDDLLIVAGFGCIATAAFLWHLLAGLVVLGAGLLIVGVGSR